MWQFHVLHQVFMKWFLCILFGEKHLLCFENYNLTSILQVSISHKMYMWHPSYLIWHLNNSHYFQVNVFERQSGESGHFLCHFQTLTDNRHNNFVHAHSIITHGMWVNVIYKWKRGSIKCLPWKLCDFDSNIQRNLLTP